MTADLDAIRARLAAATPGPWHAWDRGIGYEVHKGAERDCLSEYGTGVECCTELNDGFRETFRKGDADLIAHAPADLAALCDEVESLRAVVERVREVALAEDDEEWVRRVGKSCLVAASEILRALDGAE